MKILIITSVFPHEANKYSGVFVERTAQEFARSGHRVTVLAPQSLFKSKEPDTDFGKEYAVYRPKYLSLGAREIFGLKLRRISHYMFKRAVVKFIRKTDGDYDVVYSHFLFPAGFAALQVASSLNIGAYCCLGESSFEEYQKTYSKVFITGLLKMFESLFPNNPELDRRLKNHWAADNAHYVPNGVDTSIFFPVDKLDCRRKLKFPQDDFIILFVGGFIKRKGPQNLVLAVDRFLDDCQLVLVGSGPLELESRHLFFKGEVEGSLLPNFLNAADCFVLTSFSEGMPNALLEAMACGCAIVASDIPVHRFLLKGYPLYRLVEPNSIEDIAEAIKDIKSNTDYSLFESYKFEYSIQKRATSLLKKIENNEHQVGGKDG